MNGFSKHPLALHTLTYFEKIQKAFDIMDSPPPNFELFILYWSIAD